MSMSEKYKVEFSVSGGWACSEIKSERMWERESHLLEVVFLLLCLILDKVVVFISHYFVRFPF